MIRTDMNGERLECAISGIAGLECRGIHSDYLILGILASAIQQRNVFDFLGISDTGTHDLSEQMHGNRNDDFKIHIDIGLRACWISYSSYYCGIYAGETDVDAELDDADIAWLSEFVEENSVLLFEVSERLTRMIERDACNEKG